MSGEKPDYAEVIKSRKPLPTLDLDELRRRSALATEATTVLRSPPASDGILEGDPDPISTSDREDESKRGDIDSRPPTSVADAKAPLRFSVSKEEHHQLRIQAAVENRSVPDLMRAIIADYLRAHGRGR